MYSFFWIAIIIGILLVMPSPKDISILCAYRVCPIEALIKECYSRHNFTETYQQLKILRHENNTELLRRTNGMIMAECFHQFHHNCHVKCGRRDQTMYLLREELVRAKKDEEVYRTMNFTRVFEQLV